LQNSDKNTVLLKHRKLPGWLSSLCRGKDHDPTEYETITWLFLRLLGCIYLAAFISFGIQAPGLIGTDGILPLIQHQEFLYLIPGLQVQLKIPNIFWLSGSDVFLQMVCLTGAIFSILIIINVLLRTSLVILYLLYLSLFEAGQIFMAYQWDLLLLEAGFLAIFLPTQSIVIIWLYRWLVFRFMLLGGLVKILSHDPSWGNLTALTYYFETQPLPTPLAWYAHHLPDWMLLTGTATTLIVELMIPFFILLPRRFRMFAAGCFIILQSLIMLTGNHNFLNLLTISLCLFLFDDSAIKKILPTFFRRIPSTTISNAVQPKWLKVGLAGLAIVILTISSSQLWRLCKGSDLPVAASLAKVFEPMRIVNAYGLYSIITTSRHEIVIEGSNDQNTWVEYAFKYKPGNLKSKPVWTILHQPRLDWQMWFAALSDRDHNPWFGNLLYRILQGNKAVNDLFESNPFPDTPPGYIRAVIYDYHFSRSKLKDDRGQWWTRNRKRVYQPITYLSHNNQIE